MFTNNSEEKLCCWYLNEKGRSWFAKSRAETVHHFLISENPSFRIAVLATVFISRPYVFIFHQNASFSENRRNPLFLFAVSFGIRIFVISLKTCDRSCLWDQITFEQRFPEPCLSIRYLGIVFISYLFKFHNRVRTSDVSSLLISCGLWLIDAFT